MKFEINLKELHKLKHKRCPCLLPGPDNEKLNCPCDMFTLAGKCRCELYIPVEEKDERD